MRQLQKSTSIFLFVVLTTILIIASFLSYTKLKQFETSANSVVHTSIIKNTLTEILTNLINAETGQRGFLLTGDSVFLDSYKGAEQQINVLLTYINTLIKENDFEYKDLKILKELIASRLLFLKVNLELIQTHPPKSISDIALIKGKNKMDQVRRHAAIMLHMQDKALLKRMELKNRSASVTPLFLLTLSLLSAFFLTLFFFRLQKETNNRISLNENNRLLQAAKKQTDASEKKLQDIFRQAPVIIAVFAGENFKVEVINEFALEVLGKTEADVIGKPFFEISPNLKQTLEPFLKNVYGTGKPLIVKEYYVEYQRNGKQFSDYFNFINQVMRNVQNEITGIITIAISVTESVVARKKIEESEEKFRGLAETLPHLVWITDEKGEAVYASEKWLEYSGLNPYESANWQIVVHPDDMQEMTLAWTTSLATGKKYNAEARLKNKQGDYRWHMVEGVPLKNSEEKILKWIGAFIDIHDQKIKERCNRS